MIVQPKTELEPLKHQQARTLNICVVGLSLYVYDAQKPTEPGHKEPAIASTIVGEVALRGLASDEPQLGRELTSLMAALIKASKEPRRGELRAWLTGKVIATTSSRNRSPLPRRFTHLVVVER